MLFQSERSWPEMSTLGSTDFPGIDRNRDGNEYFQQGEDALHEDRLSVVEAPLLSSKTIGDHQTIRPRMSPDVPETIDIRLARLSRELGYL